MNAGRLKVAVVSPRYGTQVGGGAETLAREYAVRLARHHEVTVLTTRALDYTTWADHYPAGATVEDGVSVHRFSVPHPRDVKRFNRLSADVLSGRDVDDETAARWMREQGPNSPELLEHLSAFGATYDTVLFVPYLYATTVDGLPLVADRAVLVPAFHDEPPLRLPIFDAVVESAQAVVFSTPEERELALTRFVLDPERLHLVGAGIDPVASSPDPSRAARHPYVLCVGRVDPSKGSDTLIGFHSEYRRRRPAGFDLLMIGPHAVKLPRYPWLTAPGFVSEDEKRAAFEGAAALVCPSPYESLSLVLLEAWAHGRPTMCTSASPVLVGQTRRAGGGVWFSNAAEYAECLDLLTSSPALGHALGRSGWHFTRTLLWPRVIERLEVALRQAAEGHRQLEAGLDRERVVEP